MVNIRFKAPKGLRGQDATAKQNLEPIQQPKAGHAANRLGLITLYGILTFAHMPTVD